MNLLNIKVAIRNVRKDGVMSFAKLFGISFSFAVILFAAGYVYYETSFDKCIPDNDKIFRVLMQGNLNGNEADFAVTSPAMAGAVKDEIPDVVEATLVTFRGDAVITYQEQDIDAGMLGFADESFFEFFGFRLNKAVEMPFESESGIAISSSLAEQHFGSIEGALNKVVNLRGDDCVITAVFDDFPVNFHLQSKIFRSVKNLNPDKTGWGSQSYHTYIKTAVADIDVDALSFKLTKLVRTHDGEGMDVSNAKTWDDLKFAENIYIFFMAEPLTEIHFNTSHRFDPAITASKTYVYGAIILAILVLLISSFNFINLNIASLTTRFKEIGIRKTNGANNSQVAGQLIFESFLFYIIGFVLAMVFFELGEKALLQYLGIEINLSGTSFIYLSIALFLTLMFFNLLSNLLPILFYSRKETLGLMKKEIANSGRFSLKNSLVVLQFVLSALIILGSLFVQKQISFMVNKDRGYDKENVIMFSAWDMGDSKRETFIENIKKEAAIQSVTTSDVYFGDDPSMNGARFGPNENENFFHTTVMPVDYEFANTFSIPMTEGRFFNTEMESDFEAAILNETAAAEYMGEGSPVGTELFISNKPYTIIGIIKDFNFRSLYHPVQPLVVTRVKNFGNVCVKVRNDQVEEALNIIRTERRNMNINRPLDYAFHNEVVARHYVKDQQAKRLLFFLSLVSILIASIGLYAISFFTIMKRTKEIGVRIVNGARISEILTLLNKQFLSWVSLAFIIACPIAWFAMNKWLDNFAYRTELSWWVFALAGALAVGIALLTVSWQSWRAATRNPVEALRYE